MRIKLNKNLDILDKMEEEMAFGPNRSAHHFFKWMNAANVRAKEQKKGYQFLMKECPNALYQTASYMLYSGAPVGIVTDSKKSVVLTREYGSIAGQKLEVRSIKRWHSQHPRSARVERSYVFKVYGDFFCVNN